MSASGIGDSGDRRRASRRTGGRAIDISGATAPVIVGFSGDGTPTVQAETDDDLFAAQGYLQATFRLTQLDLERRIARGQLAELIGQPGVESDVFELQSGLLRTAQAQWAATPPGSPTERSLTAFTRGVNARLTELRANRAWPAIYALTGLYPQDWTPVDSLAIQYLLSQNLSYSTRPLDYALLRQALGDQQTMRLFPVIAPNRQRPYDPGPYRDLGVDPLPLTANSNAAPPGLASAPGPGSATPSSSIVTPPHANGVVTQPSASEPTAPTGPTVTGRGDTPPTTPGPHATPPDPTGPGTAETATAAADILAATGSLPQARIHTYPISNAWAANGPAVRDGRSMLAGDPHLQLTLPSFWYQMALNSPGISASGATLVGLPGIVIGHNDHIAWSITDAQNQSTMFYTEKTSPDRPGQYFWNGAWRDMERTTHTIEVRGGEPVDLVVDRTVHGPVMTQKGQTTSVAWMGNYPSASIDAIIGVNKARNFREFRTALAAWHSPTVNFTYADDSGDIAVLAAGYFPVVNAAQPWYPMAGTGENDIIGTIPYAATPQVHNPPGHVVATANQRPVTADYPYYIGTTLAAYDSGYRARRIYDVLERRSAPLTAQDFQSLQTDLTDDLAATIRPTLLHSLQGQQLSPTETAAAHQLTTWDDRMTGDSTGATIWTVFWNSYLKEVFGPSWSSVSAAAPGIASLDLSTSRAALNQVLENWTLHPRDAAVLPARGQQQDPTRAMLTAFRSAIMQLTDDLGPHPETWRWDGLHTREIPSLLAAGPLGHGPQPAGGNRFTVDAAEGDLNSSFGPSYRLVVDWRSERSADAWSIFPGGQSENPASAWYDDLTDDWWNGRLRPLPALPARVPPGTVWTLRPGRPS